uniref:CSON009901 protein n=1 Tax=Culicoides sonorensis TaxID=179676 RepID=A0A336M1Q4_CULSO
MSKNKNNLDNCPTIESNWISNDFFQTVLSSHFHDKSVKIISHEIKPAAKKGENFASAVYRVIVTYQLLNKTNHNEKISLILKTHSSNGAVQEVIEEFHVFERELTTYKEVLIECEKLMCDINEPLNFSPQLIFADSNNLVFEDVSERGYRTIDRKERLDLQHALLFIEKLAKFHATTAFLYKQNPDVFRYHMEGGLTEVETPYHAFFRTVVNEFVNTVVKSDPNLNQYLSFMTDFSENIIENVKKVFTRSNNEFHVQNHGDAWMNNMLWKNDDQGNVIDVIVVDHQEGFFGSPGIDLNHFINTSCNMDVQINHIDDLLSRYHSILSNTLEKLGAKNIPTEDDILEEVKRKMDHGIIVLTCILPIMLIEDPDLADPSNFFSESDEAKEVRHTIYSNPKYIDIVRVILPKLIQGKM